MFGFGLKNKKDNKIEFDKWVLRKNDITLLILDERWNMLFTSGEKPLDVAKCEEELKELLKLRVRLTDEQKEKQKIKKDLIEKIIALTTEVFDKKNENAKIDMHECEKEINNINNRLQYIEEEIEKIPERLNAKNLELLKVAVEKIYLNIRKKQKRVEELDKLIEETRDKLKAYIDEKGNVTEDNTVIYSYFHDLLGSDEIEKLDKTFL